MLASIRPVKQVHTRGLLSSLYVHQTHRHKQIVPAQFSPKRKRRQESFWHNEKVKYIKKSLDFTPEEEKTIQNYTTLLLSDKRSLPSEDQVKEWIPKTYTWLAYILPEVGLEAAILRPTNDEALHQHFGLKPKSEGWLPHMYFHLLHFWLVIRKIGGIPSSQIRSLLYKRSLEDELFERLWRYFKQEMTTQGVSEMRMPYEMEKLREETLAFLSTLDLTYDREDQWPGTLHYTLWRYIYRDESEESPYIQDLCVYILRQYQYIQRMDDQTFIRRFKQWAPWPPV